MEEKKTEIVEEETSSKEKKTKKSAWQQTKEGWYDKVPLSVKQLDIIIACGIGGLIITFIVIALDALGVF